MDDAYSVPLVQHFVEPPFGGLDWVKSICDNQLQSLSTNFQLNLAELYTYSIYIYMFLYIGW